MLTRYLPILILMTLPLLGGCARFGAAGPEPAAATAADAAASAAAEPTFVPVPTFTPTPAIATEPQVAESAATAPAVSAPAASAPAASAPAENSPGEQAAADGAASALSNLLPTATPGADGPVQADPVESDTVQAGPVSSESAAQSAAQSATEETPAGPRLLVTGEIVNVRGGPGTEYAIVGTATAGDTFTPNGRNAAADWWQVCCFGEEPGWLYGALVQVEDTETVALVTDIPPPPTATPAPVAAENPAPVDAAPTEPEPTEPEPTAPPAQEAPAEGPYAATAGVFDPNAQYHVVGYRVIGYGENNGGIFNNGGQHMIFVNVIDANGNGIDGAVVKNAINDNVNIVTGSKGPGRAEFEMFWDPYKLYVASDPSGPVTSQITNQMNTAHPHIPDIVGRLGPADNEYAICPTLDDRCEPPFFHAHWSYEVTFQKVN